MPRIATLTVTAVTAAAAVAALVPQLSPAPTPRSLILSAFGDAQGMFGESKPIISAMQNKVDRSGSSTFCAAVVEGTLSNQPVTAVVTGTGEQNSQACMQEMLGWYSPAITEVIWSGIAGFSPAVGGLYDNRGQRRAKATPVMIGDVCISSLSWNYDLHFSSVDEWASRRTADNRYGTAGGWWSIKNGKGKPRARGFQDVTQFVTADRALADELVTASRSVDWPTKSAGVKRKIKRFFPASKIRNTVKVFDSSRCGEVSGNNFWHSTTEDLLARRNLASQITAADIRKASAEDVVAVSAMEASGWMGALKTWNAANRLAIPMALVRGASNYDQVPLNAAGNPVNGPDGKPLTALEDIKLGFKTAGADVAIHNAAAPVLALFAARAS